MLTFTFNRILLEHFQQFALCHGKRRARAATILMNSSYHCKKQYVFHPNQEFCPLSWQEFCPFLTQKSHLLIVHPDQHHFMHKYFLPLQSLPNKKCRSKMICSGFPSHPRSTVRRERLITLLQSRPMSDCSLKANLPKRKQHLKGLAYTEKTCVISYFIHF